MFLKVLAGILGFCMIVTLGCAIAIYQTGVLVVDVKTDGNRIFVPVPMVMADFGLMFVPARTMDRIHGEVEPHQKLITAVSAELKKLPDAVFVEVETDDESVTVTKRGKNLIVDVQTDDESIYVSIPIDATGRILNKIAESDGRL